MNFVLKYTLFSGKNRLLLDFKRRYTFFTCCYNMNRTGDIRVLAIGDNINRYITGDIDCTKYEAVCQGPSSTIKSQHINGGLHGLETVAGKFKGKNSTKTESSRNFKLYHISTTILLENTPAQIEAGAHQASLVVSAYKYFFPPSILGVLSYQNQASLIVGCLSYLR